MRNTDDVIGRVSKFGFRKSRRVSEWIGKRIKGTDVEDGLLRRKGTQIRVFTFWTRERDP